MIQVNELEALKDRKSRSEKKKGDWTDEQRCVTLKSADLTVRDTFIKAVMIQLDGRLDMFSTTNRFKIRLD